MEPMSVMKNIAVADESLEVRSQRESALYQLDYYRISREIGHGGMGIVYKAEQVFS